MSQPRSRPIEAAHVRTLSDRELVQRQGIVQAQIPRAYDLRDMVALDNLQMMDDVIAAERLGRLVKPGS